jgi:hypothetical protein
MSRLTKICLPAAMLLVVYLIGFSWAQQSATKSEAAKDAPKAAAEATSAALASKNMHKMLQDKLDLFNKQLLMMTGRKESFKKRQQELRAKIYQECDLSPENVVPCMLSMEREILTLRTDMTVKEVTQKELAEQIANVSRSMKTITDDDQVLKKMQEIVENRKNNLESLKHRRDTDSVGEKAFSQAQMEISEAEIRLALRKEALLKGGKTDEIEKLNVFMRENALALVQIKTRFNMISNQYSGLR